jgi:hypothetical protein
MVMVPRFYVFGLDIPTGSPDPRLDECMSTLKIASPRENPPIHPSRYEGRTEHI